MSSTARTVEGWKKVVRTELGDGTATGKCEILGGSVNLFKKKQPLHLSQGRTIFILYRLQTRFFFLPFGFWTDYQTWMFACLHVLSCRTSWSNLFSECPILGLNAWYEIRKQELAELLAEDKLGGIPCLVPWQDGGHSAFLFLMFAASTCCWHVCCFLAAC